jgi:uncharacterized protein (DUF952 family)|tara:strand:+ start:386 stop:691 length:306 start_codon:yes stop_codon:yes gene_type:complete
VNSFVYRILHPDEWDDFKRKKVFYGNDLDKKSGYIHLSEKKQLKKTINIYFKKKKVVILKIDTEKLKKKILWETSRGGEKFPHLYDSLTLENVVKVDSANA